MSAPELEPENTTGMPDLKSLAGLDKRIHEPVRLMILAMLHVVAEADFLYLLDQTNLTRGNLSSHMARLEEADFVAVDKTFIERVPRTTYRLTAAGREAFRTYRREILAVLGDLPG
jgi:DNA-binding MarR family transcriptional regulator